MITEEELEESGFSSEYDEEVRNDKPRFTGYPESIIRYRLIVEAFNMAIEEPYFWVLEYLRNMWGFPYIIKITDVFSASENSSFFGASQQRLGLQQDKVSQFLATIGKMVKELFQLVRELRILDERLGYYADSYDAESRSRQSAEITLKGIWVDMVEQGAKNPASVYGMAREVQFTTLPDLFFNTHPLKQEDVDDVVEKDRAQFNNKVKEVLKRKLRSFLAWKEHTYEEIKNRRIFTLKYLRQHYEIVKMYMTWVKPYLRNIERLTMDQNKMHSPDIMAAFEQSMIEIEILAKKPSGLINQCILVHFLYRTRPEMNYHQEYQRGPIHVGKVQVNFRAYTWTDEQIENYQKLKAREDFKLLGIVDKSVKVSMESLGDELMRYLEEAGEDFESKSGKKIEEQRPEGNPFSSSFKSVKEMMDRAKAKHSEKQKDWDMQKAQSSAAGNVRSAIWNIYHHFKKHHNMLNW
ncbi:hypothetical protein GF323_02780 [Candidatus Woesearchaeota archaeon]|nr:hypothetical protein [Candidatus Woesearchaeota archaeon]